MQESRSQAGCGPPRRIGKHRGCTGTERGACKSEPSAMNGPVGVGHPGSAYLEAKDSGSGRCSARAHITSQLGLASCIARNGKEGGGSSGVEIAPLRWAKTRHPTSISGLQPSRKASQSQSLGRCLKPVRKRKKGRPVPAVANTMLVPLCQFSSKL